MKKLKRLPPPRPLHKRIPLFLLALFTGINILSWNSKAFTDWYRLAAFPVWTGTLGRISGLFHGSVGELLIAIGIALAAAQVFLLPIFAGEWFGRRHKAKENGAGKQPDARQKNWVQRLRRWDVRLICWVLIYIYGTETLNCYVMYHASTIEERHFSTEDDFGTQELLDAYEATVAQANALSEQVARDAKGRAVYDGTAAELYEACKKAMKAQGETYPYLSGYYPNPKPIRASYFMSQQHLLGIYFPFTMEANYNTVMEPLNVPVTVCHEYAHLKGIILEDEANYLGFAACIESEDPYLRYSGYLSVLGYLASQVRKSVPEETRRQLEQAKEQVVLDDAFLSQEQWDKVEEKSVIPTETISQATDAFLETNLTMNGVEDGIQSYGRVVRLVIRYYQKKE